MQIFNYLCVCVCVQGNSWGSGEACWVYNHLWDGVAFYHSLLQSLGAHARLADFLPPQNNGECWMSHTLRENKGKENGSYG